MSEDWLEYIKIGEFLKFFLSFNGVIGKELILGIRVFLC